jgi:hypothetical protein
MDHERLVLRIGQGLMPKPIDQIPVIWGCQEHAEGVAGLQGARATGHRQQVQVMVAEHDLGLWACRAKQSNDFGGVGAAIDQIAHKPEPVSLWPKG